MARKKYTRHRRQKRHFRRDMKGGAFTQQELQQLQGQGFDEFQIERLEDLNVSLNEVMQKVNTIMNQGSDGFNGNSDEMTEQVMLELLNEHIFVNSNANNENNMDVDQSFESQGTTNIDESDTGSMSNISGYTTGEAESHDEYGGRRRRRRTKKRRGKKSRKTRKQRGGACYGNGVGANRYDPNYSIYNTNMLKLFPYKSQ